MENDPYLYLMAFLLGMIIGSFLNVCIYRIPRRISIVTPRSFCPNCHHQIAWWQNIPIISFIFLKGKCFYCKRQISRQYPLVELSTGLLTVLLLYLFGLHVIIFQYLLLFYVLLVLSVIDRQHKIIPNKILVFLFITGVLLNLVFKTFACKQMVLGGMIALAIMLLLKYYSLIVLKKDGLGWGDVKLATVLGFFLGGWSFLLTLFVGSLIALVIQFFFFLQQREVLSKKIALVPYLSLGSLVVIFGKTVFGIF
jgi:leader peptidase (prepilin peptidase)/N-methyltransferase